MDNELKRLYILILKFKGSVDNVENLLGYPDWYFVKIRFKGRRNEDLMQFMEYTVELKPCQIL